MVVMNIKRRTPKYVLETLKNNRNDCKQHFIDRPTQYANWVLFDWYAIDQAGYIATITSVVPEPVPTVFFDISLENYMTIYDYFHDDIIDHFSEENPNHYDYIGDSSIYEPGVLMRCVNPKHPLHYTDLPDDVGRIISTTRYDGLFTNSEVITVKNAWKTCYGVLVQEF